MRVTAWCAAVLAALAMAACGGGDEESPAVTETVPDPGSAQREVRAAIQQYVTALSGGDPAKACAVLTVRAQAALAELLPRTDRSTDCEEIARRVARRSVALKRVRVSRIAVRGSTATARVTSTDPAFQSEVLLSSEDGRWKIGYPPGLVERYRTPPG